MTIEFVDPDAIDKEPAPTPPSPEATADAAPKKGASQGVKRLAQIDEQLAEALARLTAQLEKVHQLNMRLFGTEKSNGDSGRGNGPGQNRGVVLAIDTKLDEFRGLLGRLDSELEIIDTLA